MPQRPGPPQAESASLGDRHLRWLACGSSNAEFGQALFHAETAVKAHIGGLTKLGVRDRGQAMVHA
ncbi:LuxR C-terminal-related transcriptional regulator [Specibacter sp. NPDC078692]|uniref:LuxR C-terminal-related transcriptional regulator n=1 Tax=Specibacter sp. NPDC078692 TaxID=3155818 RepID=UPI003440CE56